MMQQNRVLELTEMADSSNLIYVVNLDGKKNLMFKVPKALACYYQAVPKISHI
jgi:hypothetical protein